MGGLYHYTIVVALLVVQSPCSLAAWPASELGIPESCTIFVLGKDSRGEILGASPSCAEGRKKYFYAKIPLNSCEGGVERLLLRSKRITFWNGAVACLISVAP